MRNKNIDVIHLKLVGIVNATLYFQSVFEKYQLSKDAAFSRDFVYNKFDTDYIDDKLVISDDFVQNKKYT